jgi:hypothetical protein
MGSGSYAGSGNYWVGVDRGDCGDSEDQEGGAYSRVWKCLKRGEDEEEKSRLWEERRWQHKVSDRDKIDMAGSVLSISAAQHSFAGYLHMWKASIELGTRRPQHSARCLCVQRIRWVREIPQTAGFVFLNFGVALKVVRSWKLLLLYRRSIRIVHTIITCFFILVLFEHFMLFNLHTKISPAVLLVGHSYCTFALFV